MADSAISGLAALTGANLAVDDQFEVRDTSAGAAGSKSITVQELRIGILGGVRVVTAAGAITAVATDHIIVVNKTSGAATTVNLYATPSSGAEIVIKDSKGDAGTNNITITPAAGTIDGAATLIMATNYQSVTLIYNGTEWSAI